MEAERITPRQHVILTAIIESYIETGEPVGSGTIARLHSAAAHAFSPATIRNEMAELSALGLLEQPHTSAGRVPTARAFRVYVDRLDVDRRGGVPSPADSAQLHLRSRIESGMAGVSGTQALLERTSHILASVSSGVGVAIAAVEGVDRLEHVHFSRLAPGRVLAVVVTQSGLVRDRVLALEGLSLGSLTGRELEAAAAFLNQHFRGWSIESIRAEIGRTLDRERAEYQAILDAQRATGSAAGSGSSPGYVEQLWAGAVPDSGRPVQTIAIEGVSNLLGQGAAPDLGRLRDILAALEAKERLITLLNAYIDARQASVRVIFDLEEQAPELAGLVLIAAPARMAGESRGTVGVLGPKRMQYGTTLNAVACAAEIFERILHPSA